MNLYNNVLLARHPLLQPLVNKAKPPRPAVRLWADASMKGYGAHLGPADQPIATFQQRRLTSLPWPEGKTPLKLETDYAHVHEAAAIYLSLDHFRPLVRGAAIVAHTDNTVVLSAFSKRETKEPKGLNDIWAIVDAVDILIRMEDINLEVRLVEGKNNRLADALSRFAGSGDPRYPEAIKSMRKDRVEASKAAEELIERIAVASLAHKYEPDEETPLLVPQNTPNQAPRMERATGDTASSELVTDDVLSTGIAVHVPPMSALNDVGETSGTDGFDEATLPTETPRDDFKALFRAMQRSKAAKAKKAYARRRAINTARFKAVKDVVKRGRMSKGAREVKEEAVSTQDKDVDAASKDTPAETQTTKTLSNTSGLALTEAAQELIKQAQELVKAAEKLVQAAGQKE
jgi:hypothetical protein